MPDILVINPNSNELVTEKLRDTLSDLESVAAIECITMSDGPFGIESGADAAIAASLVVERIGNEHYRDACVIACYSDPGLRESRRLFETPVFGMQESALKNAAENDLRFGVLALSDESIARHLPYIDSLELTDALAAELPLDVSVEETAVGHGILEKVIATGRRLIDEFGANAIVLGCAGLAALREPAEQALSVPVIEPVRAAVLDAIFATAA